MKYAKLFNKKATSQSQPIPGSTQVANSAGGYTWQIDRWSQLDRFLILGSENGSYYIRAQKLTADNAKSVIDCLAEDGERTVARIVEISHTGRAPKNDPALFALALATSFGDDETRALALQALPAVARTGTHLFQFAEAVDGLRGWGRGLRKAVGRWYNDKSVAELQYQAVKYIQRNGWSHRDLLRLAHPIPKTDEQKELYRWIVGVKDGAEPVATEQFGLIEAVRQLKEASPAQAAKIIRDSRVPREAVPTEMLTEPVVWEALLESMPLTAMVRNLGVMTKIGLLQNGSDAVAKVLQSLESKDRIVKARLHPMALMLAGRTYASGHGLKGSGTWAPVPKIVDALDAAFYAAFDSVEPTGKRYLLGVDVSGSMGWSGVGGSPVTACEAATAMAMVQVATEEWVQPMAFAHSFRPLQLSKRMRLVDALKLTQDQAFGRTDCALPMLYASQHKLKVDVFVVYTDNETWYGNIHPAQALQAYRQQTGIAAKLIVVGIVGNSFSIADPGDAGMLDVVGFDASVPQVMSEFARA